jgi:hypothetical protein
MKVLILSDLHLGFDVVILAGDIHSLAKRAVQWAADRFRGNPRGYLNLASSRHGESEKDFKPALVVDV